MTKQWSTMMFRYNLVNFKNYVIAFCLTFYCILELQKLAGSSAVDELHVKCGLCKESKTICGDRSVSGKVNHFKSST